MSAEGLSKPAKQAKEDFAVISNRLAVALAKRESLIKSWTNSSSRPPLPSKTEEELEAEDATLFRNQPPYLGVGAPIPSHFLVSEAERNNKSLRAKFFPTKGLKASKARDAEEKAASAKRGLKEESSDEEEGRSGLGRAKKLKMTKRTEPVKKLVKAESDSEEETRGSPGKLKKSKSKSSEVSKHADIEKVSQGQEQILDSNTSTSKGKLEGGSTASKQLEASAAGPDDISRKLEIPRPTDPAELRRLKKKEKKRRQKLRAAQKDSTD